MGVGDFLHTVAFPRHQLQNAHERLHIAYTPWFFLQLLPLRSVVDAGKDVCVRMTQRTEQGFSSSIFPNHLKQVAKVKDEEQYSVQQYYELLVNAYQYTLYMSKKNTSVSKINNFVWSSY